MSDNNDKSLYRTRYSLIERVQDPNDEEAWKEFVSLYEQYIYNILRHLKINEADSKEIKQDIIVKLWKKLPEFAYNRDRGKFRQWLGAVIRNDANQFFRKNKREANVIDKNDDHELEKFIDPIGNFDLDSIISDEWNDYISNLAWESIKDRFQESMQQAFLLYIEGTSYKEIAKSCNIAENSTKVYIKRIRDHLKSEIIKFNEELL